MEYLNRNRCQHNLMSTMIETVWIVEEPPHSLLIDTFLNLKRDEFRFHFVFDREKILRASRRR